MTGPSDVSQTVAVKGSAQHDTLTENISNPIVYDVAAEDSRGTTVRTAVGDSPTS